MRVTDADDADGRGVAVAAGRALLARGDRGGLVGGLVAAGVGGDEHATVVEVHEPAVADDLDGLTGEPHPGQVVRPTRS